MTLEETIELLTKLTGFYPGMRTNKAMPAAWHEILVDISFESAMNALKQWVMSKEDAPKNPGQLLAACGHSTSRLEVHNKPVSKWVTDYYHNRGLVQVVWPHHGYFASKWIRPQDMFLYPDGQLVNLDSAYDA